MKKTILVCCIALMTLAGLSANGTAESSANAAVPSNTKTALKEEKADGSLLIIDKAGILTGVTDKTKLTGKLILPAEVKRIGKRAFSGCTGLTSIDFSGCTKLTKIGEEAFQGCIGLTEVRLPASLTEIQWDTFKGCCNLHLLTVEPANKTYCSKDNIIYTKDMTKLVCAAGGITYVSIPDTVTEICGWTFEDCTVLTEVHLHANLTMISENAFKGCSSLHTLTVDPANTTYCSKDNVLYTKDMKTLIYAAEGITELSIPDTVTKIFGHVFSGCGNLHTLTVDPANKMYCSKDNIIYTKDMTKLVLAAKDITQVSIPDTVTQIDWYAFSDCAGLTSVDFSACTKLTEIDGYAFKGCRGLTNVDLSACTSLTEIGDNAFSRCTSLTSVDFSACTGLTIIDSDAFFRCTSLTEIRLPASIRLMAGSAFRGCSNLRMLTVDPANPVYCTKDNIIYRKDMTELVCAARGITQVSIPDTVTQIGEFAFSGSTGLTSVDFSACTKLTKIGWSVFSGCTGIAEVRLPAGLTEIDRSAFAYCSSLHTLTVDSANTTYCSKDNVLYTKDMTKLVCAARGITYISIPDTVTEIGEEAFSKCMNLTDVDFSSCTSLKIIAKSAFYECTDLKNVDLSGCTGLTGIGEAAFSGCIGLTSVDLSGCTGLTEIDGRSFEGCTDCSEVLNFARFTDFTKIGAFSGCTGLTEVHLPASLTKIGVNAFRKCSNLHTLIVDPANKTYCSKDNVLYTKDMKTLVCAAGAITHISIPDTVIEIAKYAFEDISPDARFTVATEAVKQLLKDSESGIKDEQITVKDAN